MADFNAQANEYSPLRTQLQTVHNTQIKNINAAFTVLKLVAATNGGFHVEATSKKINKLLDTISDDVLPALAVVFSESESSMDNFVSKVEKLDKES